MLWFNFLDFWRMCGGDLERLCCEMRACACMFTHGGGKFLLGARRKQVHVRTALLPRWYHADITLIPRCHHTVAPMWCYFLAPCVMTIPRRQAFSEDGGGKMHVDDIYLHCRCCHLCRNTLVLPPHTAVAALFVDPGLAEGR